MPAARLEKLRNSIAAAEIDGLMVTRPENRRYISGFTGSSGALVITADKAVLITDFRYVEQAKIQAPEFEVVMHGTPFVATLKEVLASCGVRRLGFESDHLTFAQHRSYSEALEGIELVPAEGLVEKIRIIKDAGEIEALAKAAELGDAALEEVLRMVRPGVTERELALELEFFMRRHGADKVGFDFIVASGERSALPHGVASDKEIKLGDLITFDFGCYYEGYTSDMTRTVVLGKADAKQREIYELVLRAQLAALEAIKPGASGVEVDKVARDIISAAGHGEHFGHGLGHGVGLMVHEGPRLSPSSADVLEPGMVVTDEPGVYIPGWGGVRIEDLVVVTEEGSRVLTKFPKELIEL